MRKRRLAPLLAVATLLAPACVEPPPRIAAIPASGLSLRVYVFGASAEEVRRAFEAVKENNKTFTVVKEGGDGEVLVGLENDSPKCVPPTGLCSFRVSYRIRDKRGTIVHASSSSVTASTDSCSALCAKAINNVAVKVVETAAASLKGDEPAQADAGITASGGEAMLSTDAAATMAPDSGAVSARGVKKPHPRAEAVKPEPLMCAVGAGARLPSEEAEKRAAQVEILRRLSVLDQDEYDCLRKAYLGRL